MRVKKNANTFCLTLYLPFSILPQVLLPPYSPLLLRGGGGEAFFLFSFPLFPLYIHIRQATSGNTTLTSTTIAGFRNETDTHTTNQGCIYIFRFVYAVFTCHCCKIERAYAIKLYRATLRHIIAHHTAQGCQHSTHIGRANRRSAAIRFATCSVETGLITRTDFAYHLPFTFILIFL